MAAAHHFSNFSHPVSKTVCISSLYIQSFTGSLFPGATQCTVAVIKKQDIQCLSFELKLVNGMPEGGHHDILQRGLSHSYYGSEKGHLRLDEQSFDF